MTDKYLSFTVKHSSGLRDHEKSFFFFVVVVCLNTVDHKVVIKGVFTCFTAPCCFDWFHLLGHAVSFISAPGRSDY